MSSENDQEIEYKLNEEYAIPDLNHIKNIKRIQSPMRLLLFRQYTNEIEQIKESIFLRVGNSFFFKLRQLLTELYLNCQEQMIQQKRKYFDENNIFILFLLNVQIEIDVRRSSISNIILPIAFKNYIDKQKYRTQSYCQQYEIDQLLFKKICLDFQVYFKKIDYSKIYRNCWYNLFYILSKQSLNQKNEKYLDQFLQEVISNSKQNGIMEKQPNQQFMYGEQYNNQSLDSQNNTSIKQKFLQQNENQKNIKVIKITKINFGKTLIKQQNQEIIISKCSNSMIPLGKDNIIYYNQKYDVKLSKMYNKRILCTGDLDYVKYNCLYNRIMNYRGKVYSSKLIFISHMKDNLIKDCKVDKENKYFLINNMKDNFDKGRNKDSLLQLIQNLNQKPILHMSMILQNGNIKIKMNLLNNSSNKSKWKILQTEKLYNQKILSDMILKTLNIGQCLQEKIIDYYLVQMQNHYKQLHKEQINYIIINTMNCQDIFSSQLNYVNFDYHNLPKLINLKLLKALVETDITGHKDKLMRTIFAINLSRSHFITIVIENFEIYILNSLSSNLVELCEIFKQAYKQSINKQLYYKPEDYEIQIHQQNNFYSCGVHTCYVINQLIKQHNVPIKEIKFNNTNQVIDDYTTYMKNVILTRNSIHIHK